MYKAMLRAMLCLVLLISPVLFAQSARPRLTGLSHLAVYTSDAAKAERFYVHDLGATRRDDPEDAKGVRYYFNAVQFVEVLPLPAGWASPVRMDHAAFNTENAEQMRRYLGAHQVAVPAAVTKGSDGSEFFEVKDPEGNRVQFVQPPLHAETVPNDPLSSHMIHIGFIVHSQAVEDTFYHDILGFRAYWHGGPGDTTAWVSSQLPDSLDWLEYMMVRDPSAPEMLAAGDRLGTRHGGPQLGRDGKWQLNLFDPDETRAELMEFRHAIKPCCSEFLGVGPVK